MRPFDREPPHVTARLDRKMSLVGTVFFLVGNIVGASIFILPGELAGIAGPAVFLAYLLAAVPAAVNCLIAAQAGTLLPVSAADYVFTSVMLHPFLGFLKVWTGVVSLLVSTPLLAYGFAEYMAYFLPDADRFWVATTLVFGLLGLNLAGLTLSIGVQMFMVVLFIAALFAFGIGGLLHADFGNLVPLAPNGVDAIFRAAVPAFYSYSGFLMLIIMAEEIREPQKNIPRALGITFLIVAATYTMMTVVMPALVPWQQLGTMVAPVSTASQQFMPPWFATVITVAALLAAATSANVAIVTGSRSLFALARSEVLPKSLGWLSPRTNEPALALVATVVLAMIGVIAQGEIVQYASIAVIGAMVYGIVWAVALWRMPAVMGAAWQAGAFRLGRHAITAIVIVKIAVSLLFLWFGISGNPALAVIYLVIMAIGSAYYVWRSRWLAQRGIDIGAIFRAEATARTPAAA